MNEDDQFSYLQRRIAEQRALAAAARNADIGAFHTRLVDHYSRLLADAQALSTPFFPVRSPNHPASRPASEPRQVAGRREQSGR